MRFIAAINTRIYGVYYSQGSEVNVDGWARKQMLQFLNNGLIQASQITSGAIQDAITFEGGDVTTTVDADGRLVVSIETEPKSIDWLTDVDTASTDPIVDGSVLVWDEIDAVWKPAVIDLSGATISIANLSDVDVAGAIEGSVLVYDEVEGTWVAGAPPAGSIIELTDVDVSGGIDDGDVLLYDYTSGTWIPGVVTGAIGPAGPVCWSYPVAWSSTTAYTTGPPASVVVYDGSAYVCTLANTNVVPTNTTYWALLVSKGDTGAPGDTGPAGPAGPGVAAGGTTGQHLVKASSTDYDTSWEDPPNSLPTGGSTGQILTKASATDYDAEWSDAATVIDDVTFSWGGDAEVVAGSMRLYNDSGATRTLDLVRVSAGTSPVGADLIVDVNIDGTTCCTTKPTVAAAASTGTATPSTTAWPDGSYLTVDIDQVGSTTPGADLTITVSYH